MNQTEINNAVGLSLSGFPHMDDSALETVRQGLGLSMSSAELRTCRTYYRNSLRRDPQAEELLLLDRMIESGSRSPQCLCVAEMKTASKLIADIFADLMARRPTVVSELERPSSLPELIGLMESYLASSEKYTNSLSDVAVRFTSHRDLLLTSEGYLITASTGSEDKDISIGVKPPQVAFSGGAVKPGDYVYALLDSKNPDDGFEKRLTQYLSENAVKLVAKSVRPVCNSGLLDALVQLADGLTLNTKSLISGADFSLPALADPVFGVLLTASPAASADILLLAQEMGLHMIRTATVTAGAEIRIPAKNGGFFTFHAPFLRSLTLPRAYSATVAPPANTLPEIALTRIGTCTLNGQKHAVVKADASGDNPFVASLFGTLYAFLLCVAAGARPSEVGLACHLTLPRPSSTRMGESLSMILGLYRMQAEFEMYGNTPTLESGTDEHPSLSIATIAPLPEHPTPSTVVGGGSKIFYLEPLYTADGIPDFSDLKKMLGYIEKLNRDGHILSILPTSGDLLSDLEKMSRNTTVEYVRREPLTSRFGGLLVETDVTIQGALVAVTEAEPEIEPKPESEEAPAEAPPATE